MAKDYFKVEPDYTRLMQKHYNTGRAGQKIEFIVRHHAAGVLTTDQMWQVWQSRQASAHYNIEVSGRVGQLVYDNNTAWATGSTRGNQRGISIEHSNSGGAAQDWPIADATIDEGARWAAALCRFYNLGRPQYGRNIFDHRDFYATSCGYHLARGGRYDARWMRVAQAFYDELTNPPKKEEGLFMSLPKERQEDLARKIDRIHHELTYGFQSRYVDPETGEQSTFKETLVGYVLEADKKLENMNAVQLPAIREAIEKES